MKLLTFVNKQTFADYLEELKDSMQDLTEYYKLLGKSSDKLDTVNTGLHHADPFITYKASLAASLMLADKQIYH